jgi:ankyrin repeat protein
MRLIIIVHMPWVERLSIAKKSLPNVLRHSNVLLQDGFTALHWAAYVGNLDSLKLLVSKGADLKAKNAVSAFPRCRLQMHELVGFHAF